MANASFRSSPLLWSYLVPLMLLVSPPVGAEDAGVGPVAPPQDGGVGGAPDDGAEAVTPQPVPDAESVRPPTATAPDLEPLRDRLEQLRSLTRPSEEAPEFDAPSGALFNFDLADEEAVSARLATIESQIQSVASEVDGPLAVDFSTTSSAPLSLQRTMLELETLRAEKNFLSLSAERRRTRVLTDENKRANEREREEAKGLALEAEREAAAAEVVQLRALQEAERARTESLRDLKNRVATVAKAKGELADRERERAEQQEARAARAAKAIDRAHALVEREGTASAPAELLTLYGEFSAELRLALDALDAALDRLDEQDVQGVVDIERPEPGMPGSADEEKAAKELESAVANLENDIEDYRQQLNTFRLQSVRRNDALATTLVDGRARIFKRLPSEQKSAFVGLSRNALEAARLETRYLTLSARSQPILQSQNVERVPTYLRDLVTLGKTFWTFLKVLLVICIAVWVKRRLPRLRKWSKKVLTARFRFVRSIRRVRRVENFIEDYGDYLVLLGAIHLVHWALGPVGELPAVQIVFSVVLWVAYYLLLRTWLLTSILWAVKQRRGILSAVNRADVLRSATLVGRTVLFYGLLNSVAHTILRDGVLFNLAQLVLLILVLLVLVALLRSWRRTIARAYLRHWSEGRLARLIDSTQDHWVNLFIVAVALTYVLVRGITVLAGDFILGFEQSRKALAFLFRKRLERKSEKHGTWENELHSLPQKVLRAFSIKPLGVSDDRVFDSFPGAERLAEKVGHWDSGHKGSFLLKAGRGFGKTTWILHVLGVHTQLVPKYLQLERTDDAEGYLVRSVGAIFGRSELRSLSELIRFLNEQERTLCALDDIHLLYTRKMGGLAGVDALMQLIEETSSNVFWLCSVDVLAWRHIQAARPTRLRFRGSQHLDAWSEENLRNLLALRAAVSETGHEFEDVIVASDSEDKSEALQAAAEGYSRLIWDYSDGCPLVALRFWLHSLVPSDSTRVRVRLFRQPNTQRLERIPEEGNFVYAALAVHDGLSAREAAEVTEFSELICSGLLDRGLEEGYLERDGETSRYYLSVDWRRQMIRHLRSKQAL